MYQEWIKAKQAESDAVAARREIEDKLVSQFKVSEGDEGAQNFDDDGFKIKITGRINRKVDGDVLQELAREAGLSEHLGRLFRWKPEIVMGAWKASDEAITGPLLGAITSSPGRPSFTIVKDE